MDEATLELLSRYLDGDLPADEAASLEQRLDDDDQLRTELESMERLRGAVRALAAAEQPPAELETLLEPLRRSTPSPQGLRPAFRWLAAAATVALGVGVAVQVMRQNPAPTLPAAPPAAPPAATATDDGYYQLKPLPTRSAAEGEVPLTAAERLLATPLPAPEIGAARPMEVVGPLDAPQPGRETSEEMAALERESATDPTHEADRVGDEEARLSAAEEPRWAPVPAEGETRQRQVLGETGAGARQQKSTARPRPAMADALAEGTAAGAELRIGARTLVIARDRLATLEAGTYRLRVTVGSGMVTACQIGDDRDPQRSRVACTRVLGLSLDGIADGQHSVELIVP